MATPGRLGSEPATTPANPFGIANAAPPSPLTLYPGRPNARYEDIEAPPGTVVELGISQLRLTSWIIEPRDDLPGLSTPAKISDYRTVGLADGYTPTVTDTFGDILHIVVHMEPTALPAALACSATTADDGSVLLPYDRPPPRPPATTARTTVPPPADIDLHLPLGVHRGRIYIVCRNSFAHVPIGDDRRAVWGIDV